MLGQVGRHACDSVIMSLLNSVFRQRRLVKQRSSILIHIRRPLHNGGDAYMGGMAE